MSRSVRKGYCRDCQANVNHLRRFVSHIAWLLDALTFRFIGRFRFGYWHCMQCTRKSVYLPLARRDVRTIAPLQTESESESHPVETAGNYLRNESLLSKKGRISRYSSKYREGVVKKILSGHATIAEMKRELNVSEADLLDWIASAFDGQNGKIRQLTEIINRLNANGNVQLLKLQEELRDNVVEASATRDLQ